MPLVVLIENPEDEAQAEALNWGEADMRRWWDHRCVKVERDGEVWFEVAGRFKLYEGVKRWASFGVKARIARRPCLRRD